MITVTAKQRGALTHLLGSLRTPAALTRRAHVVLHAAAGLEEEQIAKRVGLELGEVEATLETWTEAAKMLTAAEKAGTHILREQIRELLEPLTEDGSDCGCGCDDDAEMRGRILNDQQIAQLAVKVYDLLRYELRIERERVASGRYRI